MLIYHCFVTHHTTTLQENIDIKCAFQSYYMKKYILVHFEIHKKLIVVGLFLLLAGFAFPEASFGRRFRFIHENYSLQYNRYNCYHCFTYPQPYIFWW